MMEMKAVKSSMFTHAGYYVDTARLTFTNGTTYDYKMPRDVFEGLLAAESAGKYFGQHVRKQYPGVRASSDAQAGHPSARETLSVLASHSISRVSDTEEVTR